jgi:predicted aspartyl protease
MTFTDLSNFAPLKLADGTTLASAGLLGSAYFKALPVAVDFPKSRILVARAKIQGGLAGIKAQLGAFTAPMMEDPQGRHYLVIEANGKKALLLVDLGAISTVVYEKAAESLKLEIRGIAGTVNTLGRKNAPRKASTIDSLKIGDHPFAGPVEVMVMPGEDVVEVSGVPVIGLAGCSLFETLESTVDFSADKITLSSRLIKIKK